MDAKALKPTILYVDDEANALKYFDRIVGSLGTVITATSVDEGMLALDEHRDSIRVLISDQRMPVKYGNELLAYALVHYPRIIRILTTAHSELDEAIKAVNEGQIHRYIRKPWDVTQLRVDLKQALELAELASERELLMREKMSVQGGQILAQRVGALRTICNTVSTVSSECAVNGYLGAAAMVNAKNNGGFTWVETDFMRLVSVESSRAGHFGYAVKAMLEQFRQCAITLDEAISLLTSCSDGKIELTGARLLRVKDEAILIEFLRESAEVLVSRSHAAWLAFLCWLQEQGASANPERQPDEIRIVIQDRESVPATDNRLVGWIEHFMEMELMPSVQQVVGLYQGAPRH